MSLSLTLGTDVYAAKVVHRVLVNDLVMWKVKLLLHINNLTFRQFNNLTISQLQTFSFHLEYYNHVTALGHVTIRMRFQCLSSAAQDNVYFMSLDSQLYVRVFCMFFFLTKVTFPGSDN